MILFCNKYHKIDTVDKNYRDYGNEKDHDNDEININNQMLIFTLVQVFLH